MATVLWGPEIASVYDATSAEMFAPAVLRPAVDVLASLAGGGAALEFAVGTGRVALPLSERGVPVAGIELSPDMAAVLRGKPGAAAAHLVPGGWFVVEVGLPAVSGRPAGELGRVFDISPGHVGVDTIDDPVAQITSSHHLTLIDGQWRRSSAPYRYVWPSELDLMGRLAGFRLEHRWAGWDKAPFTAASTSQVAVYRLPTAGG
jgi:hypothetical protein